MLLEKLRLLKKIISAGLVVLSIFFVVACEQQKTLPIYGERDYFGEDTIYHKIPNFFLINQDSAVVTEKDFENHIYIADFFFTTCPSICPIMTTQLFRVQEYIKTHNLPVKLLSHTVDPETDQPAILKAYAIDKEADFTLWDFVTGDKEHLYDLAMYYLVVAKEDPEEEIYFVHSDKLVLIDKEGKVRGLYSGIDEKEVNQLLVDLTVLMAEYGSNN